MRNKLIYISLQQNFTVSIKHLLSLMTIVLMISSLNASAQVNFDLAFGSGGKVVSSPDGSEVTFGQDYALLTDGKIIAVGGGSTLGFIVARYNANGSLDTGFGTNGWNSITFPDYSTSAIAVDIQADGKIVAAGTVRRLENNLEVGDFAVARFNADGSLDTTFDGDGKTTVSFVPELIPSSFARENLSSLKIATDGKIIVGGSAGIPGPGGNSRFIFARLNTDGSLDTTFDGDGKLLGVAGFMYLNDLTVLADGSIVAVGSDVNLQQRLAFKYDTSGGLVWTYQYIAPPQLLSREGFHGITVQPDGKLIMVGARAFRVAAFRLNADGTADSSFGAPTGPLGTATSVAVQPDGKIVAHYYLNSSSGRSNFNLIRFNADGSLDSSFGSGGIQIIPVSAGSDFANEILIQPDGKILVGGYSSFTNPTKYYFSMLRLSDTAATTRRTFYDYDGDAKADVSVYRPSAGAWYLNNSTSGFSAANFGIASDSIVPADYDGDGKTDVAVFRDGNWYMLRSFDNSFSAVGFGQTGDVPVPADYDGDGRADTAVFRGGTWYLNRSTFGFTAISFGVATDKPQPSDYDGDGKADVAVFRPSAGEWYRINSSNGSFAGVNFGLASDAPVPADYDGDGKADYAVYRPSSGDWYYLKSSNGSFTSVNFGISTDKPVPADYDGDGKADVAVYRPSAGAWYINQSTAGFSSVNWGISTDIPTAAAYIR